ncbi:NERD domain-containing protein [Gracilibacillus oryzae]|uniref:NERD domain-containing protein n=1 Tax=Gracilibacillus oryzae TaxID=1672701 RepID=A0A7C8GSC4_9BACI|nr:nuclease-related domain-containing protein [Gracilibacillus oryzae]KAB8127839.1 NERD domain-containing protein [Gracilibacillus oryzae]
MLRKKPNELIVYESLALRKSLSKAETKKYKKLKRGYEGELLFDAYLEPLQRNYLLLRDVWLSSNNKTFQLDHTLLINNAIYLYEVKNFIGEYYYSNYKLYLFSGKEIDDPLIQLKRTESLLSQLLHLGYQVPIYAAVVFINPECTIFQAPATNKILLPTQLNRYFQAIPDSVTLDPVFPKLANKLESIRLEKSPYETLPDYQYKELKRGIPCIHCRSFYTKVEGKGCICQKCGERERFQSAILRTAEEFMILFPGEKVTSERILEWCNLQVNLERIRYTLQKNFEMKGNKKGAYYIRKNLE